MNYEEPLVELLFERLASDVVANDVAETVLAALAGDDDLTASLGGQSTTLDSAREASSGPRPKIHLSSVTVAGFRGVGSEQRLDIQPGPGLTLVVGRNGSGKSSFAEAIEFALTGKSARWADKNSVWRTGWRNLHEPDPCMISVELNNDGDARPTRVRRFWPIDADLADVEVAVSDTDGHPTSLAGLGLVRPLELYRPFLTAADLTKLVNGTPSESFDAINSILGLEPLGEADKRLMAASRPLDQAIKEMRARHATLRASLEQVDDDRARRTAAVLADATPDLAQIDAILAEPLEGGDDPLVKLWQDVAKLTLPEEQEVARLVGEVNATASEAMRHDGSRERLSIRTAELLRLALDHHSEDGDGPCPVCGTGALTQAWRTTATASLDELKTSTIAARQASSRLTDRVRHLRGLVEGITLPEGDAPDTPFAALREAVAHLRGRPSGAEALAAHVTSVYPQVQRAGEAVRVYAGAWLAQRDHGWQDVIEEVRMWVAAARRWPEQERALTLIKNARSWLRTAGDDIRNTRLAPFADHSQQIWAELRQESNVRLGAMALAGTGTRRRVVFPVSVDGADNGHALGVMSQGELHALGLATFLPRSCADESPFRFVVIDDPVQSMDPSKVDGLARVLGALAESRQVVVFTHDTRLPDAVRRLEIDAITWEVVRAEQSAVTLRQSQDPVSRYLDDANAVALSNDLPEDVRSPVVAELCRSALEAACHRVVWRVRSSRGDTYSEVESALDKAKKTATVLALALFDDAERGSDVAGKLRQRHGQWAVETYDACRKGAHGRYRGNLPRLVADTRSLTGTLT